MALRTGRGDAISVPPALTRIAAGTPCGRCRTQMQGQYFVANGVVVCEACRESLHGSTGRAIGLGVVAAIITAAVYYAVFYFWNMNFVLIAVLAGVLIGLSVRRGAQSSRLPRYRWIAVGLTYVCIVSTYYPALLALPGIDSAGHAALRAVYLPVLMLIGLKNPVTLILLGFGLHEAWKLSAPHVVNVDGPFQVVQPPAATPITPGDG
jgi:uncharacterized membrane protein